jgi:hypothetical protein
MGPVDEWGMATRMVRRRRKARQTRSGKTALHHCATFGLHVGFARVLGARMLNKARNQKREDRMSKRKSRFAAITIVVLAGLVFGVTQAIGSSNSSSGAGGLEPTQPAVPEPLASYQSPTGPALSDAALHSIALKESARAGDTDPSSIEAIDTTYAAGVHLLDPESTLPEAASAGESSYRASSVVVIILHGQFVLPVSTPSGRPEPSGPVLSLVVDAHTGHVDIRGIEESSPPELTELGSGRSLAQ